MATDTLDYPNVVVDTTELTREQWLLYRHAGIGGSDTAAILGISPWASRRSLWETKVAAAPKVTKSTEAMEFGTFAEPLIATMVEQMTGHELVNDTHLYAHPEHDFMLANLDRRIGDEAVVEIKTSSRQWEEVPDYYVSQIQHYMAVTNLPHAYCAVLFNRRHFRLFDVPRDEIYIERLIAAEQAFWDDVKEARAPLTDGHEATIDALRSLWTPEKDKTIELGDELLDLISQREAAKRQIDEVNESVRAVEARIMDLMGDAEIATAHGDKLVTWKAQTRNSVDAKALGEAHPDLAKEFTKSSTYRVLRVAGTKE